MATRKPTSETIAFGREVAKHRTDAGLSRLELAKLVTVTRSYIAQVENGTTRCREDFAQRLDEALETTPALTDAWSDLLRSAAYPKAFADYPKAEETAAFLRMYGDTFVIGLLQTKEYASVLAPSQAILEGRIKRQQILTRTPPPRLAVVLSEAVFLREVGTPEIMRAQCEHLLEVSTWGNVHLQVARIAYYWGVTGSFSIATQPTGENLLNQEIPTGGVTTNGASDILECVMAFAGLQAQCLNVGDTRDFLRKAVDRWALMA